MWQAIINCYFMQQKIKHISIKGAYIEKEVWWKNTCKGLVYLTLKKI